MSNFADTLQSDHRKWLRSQAFALLDFFQPNILNPKGGFFTLAGNGRPLPGEKRAIHDTARMVHAFVIADQIGQPNATQIIDHGMAFLWDRHRDKTHGGYFTSVGDFGAKDTSKQAYGHAFVLLAASSAKIAGHPDADRLLADVSEVILTRFWDTKIGVMREEYTPDWQALSPYRGQNSNMHMTEALLAAYEATNDAIFLEMAQKIAGNIINIHARSLDWRVAEHFNHLWQIDRPYDGNQMFRPFGITPGHALEWARLLVQLWQTGGRKQDWMLPAALALFERATHTGWDAQKGGFFYTLDWHDIPHQTHKFWWPCAEGIGAAAALGSVCETPKYLAWYQKIWAYCDNHFIDHTLGGWWPEIPENGPNLFAGKPDIYHALQACLIPLLASSGSVTRGLSLHNSARFWHAE